MDKTLFTLTVTERQTNLFHCSPVTLIGFVQFDLLPYEIKLALTRAMLHFHYSAQSGSKYYQISSAIYFITDYASCTSSVNKDVCVTVLKNTYH